MRRKAKKLTLKLKSLQGSFPQNFKAEETEIHQAFNKKPGMVTLEKGSGLESWSEISCGFMMFKPLTKSPVRLLPQYISTADLPSFHLNSEEPPLRNRGKSEGD